MRFWIQLISNGGKGKSVLGIDIPEKYPSLVMENKQTAVDVARAINNELTIKKSKIRAQLADKNRML